VADFDKVAKRHPPCCGKDACLDEVAFGDGGMWRPGPPVAIHWLPALRPSPTIRLDRWTSQGNPKFHRRTVLGGLISLAAGQLGMFLRAPGGAEPL